MKKKTLFIWLAITGIIVIFSGCYQTDRNSLGSVMYIIQNETGHKFSLVIKNPDDFMIDSIVLNNGESYKFAESGMGGFPPPFSSLHNVYLNIYFDNELIKTFCKSGEKREPIQYSFFVSTNYSKVMQQNENEKECTLVMDKAYYDGFLKAVEELKDKEKKLSGPQLTTH